MIASIYLREFGIEVARHRRESLWMKLPKKIIESSFKCFICSSASLKNNKILIFGKSSLDIAGAIRSSLSVDVSRYSENSDLFVCRDKCYQRLIKFQRASDKLKELKREIEEVFNARKKHREKRLLQSNKGNIISGEEGANNTVTPARDTIFSSRLLTDKTRAMIGKMILAGLPQVYVRETVIG